jgi:putative membrane protein
MWQFDFFDVEPYIDRFLESGPELPAWINLPGVWGTTIIAISGLLLVLMFFKLLSLAWIVIKFWGFTLTADGPRLRSEYGLLTKISATIPRHRIQLFSVKRGPLQRLLGRASIQVETAGGRDEDEGSSVDRLWIAPLIREERVAGLLARIEPQIDLTAVDWQPLAPGARRRLLRKSLLLVILASAALCAILNFSPWGLLLLVPGLPFAIVHATLWVRHAGYARTGRAIYYKSGWLVRRMSVVRCSKIQAVSLGESPFDRRNAMARLAVDTAGAGRVGHGIRIRYLLAETAEKLETSLFQEASSSAFRW